VICVIWCCQKGYCSGGDDDGHLGGRKRRGGGGFGGGGGRMFRGPAGGSRMDSSEEDARLEREVKREIEEEDR
jgi:hypothetical protein